MSNVTIDSKSLNLLLGAAIEQQHVMILGRNEWTDEPAEMSRELVQLQHDVSALEDAFTEARRLLNEAEEKA